MYIPDFETALSLDKPPGRARSTFFYASSRPGDLSVHELGQLAARKEIPDLIGEQFGIHE
jgi:hypothetical protein